MFIAGLGFSREDAPPEARWCTYGKIWYDAEGHRCSLFMTGFRQGMFVAKPFRNIKSPPFLSGDITIVTGEYEDKEGLIKKQYQKSGFIYTDQDESGATLYLGVLDVLPIVSISNLVRKEIELQKKEGGPLLSGIWLPVFLTENEQATQNQI